MALAPINPYGTSKLMSEWILRDLAAVSDLRYVSLRYFNVAGSDPQCRIGQATAKATLLIKVACEAVVGKRTHVSIYGTDYPTPDGTCVRDYIHVLDIADSHVRALEEIDKVAGEAFNVGNSRGYSILEVIDAVERITGKKIPKRLSPRRSGDPAVLVASKDKLKKLLGWEAQHSTLDEIVSSAWAWKQAHPNGYA